MKKRFLTIASLCFITYSMLLAQERSINFVISIDNEIAISSLSNFKILAYESNDNFKQLITVDYVPGNLFLKEQDYKRIISNEIKSFYLIFNFDDQCTGQGVVNYSYNIELKKGWLDYSFFVLKIYNTSKRKYKKIFEPLKGKDYTYEYYYPGGQMLRVTKKKRRKECN